jgi:pimeloyl-ACP methyl ester carboxylesterase
VEGIPQKKALLFLHGYLADKNSFIYQTEYFKNFFDVYAPDLKGFGENKGMQYPYSLDDYVLDVKNYIKQNGLVRPHVIAHSFGGRIVIKALKQDNDIFDKVVLTGSAGLKPKSTVKKTVKRLAFRSLKPFLGKERLKSFYSKDYLALSPIMRESFIKIVNEHLDDCLELINNKTLIIFGRNDTETPLYMAKKLNSGIKNSKLIVVNDAGHFCFIDKPLTFNTEVREFLLSKNNG